MTPPTQADLLDEVQRLRRRVAELEGAETERLRIALTLENSQRHLENILTNAAIVIWAMDPQGIIVLSEGRGLVRLGFQPGELLGQSIFDFYRDRPNVLENIRRALAGEDVNTITRIDGCVMKSWMTPVRSSDGQIMGVQGMAIDITEQAEAEKLAAESSQFFQRLANTSPAGVFRADREGRCLYVNEQSCRLAGISEEMAKREGWLPAVHPDDHDRVVAMAQEAIHQGMPFRLEHRFLHADGKVVWVLGSAAPQRDAKGELIGFVGTMIDITENKLVAAQLEFQAKMLAHVDDAVVATDEQQTITYWNEGAEKLYGIPASQAVDRPRDEVLHFGWVSDEHRQEYLRSMAATGSWRGETLYTRPDGQTMQIESSVRALRDSTGQPAGIISATRDVTLRHRAEATLQQAHAELEQRVAERTESLLKSNDELRREITQREKAETQLRDQTRVLQSILDGMSDGVIAVNNEGRLLLVNRAASLSHGISMGDVEPHQWLNVWQAYYADRVTPYPPEERPLRRALRGETILSEEMYFVHPQTQQGIWLNVNAGPLRDEGGNVIGSITVFRNDTQHKAAERSLRESEARLQSILDSTPSVVYLKDLEGRYLLANRTFDTLFNLSSVSYLGKTDFDFFASEVAQRFRENDLRVIEAGVARQFDEWAPHADGEHLYISVKFPLHDADGRVYALCGISTDITDRKWAEQKLRQEQDFLRRLLTTHERDRQLMAYEIHDGLVQDITAAVWHLDAVHKSIDALPPNDRELFEASLILLRRSIDDARRVLSGLRPPILDEQGIVMAIRYLVSENSLPREVEIEFESDVQFDRLEPLLEGTIFRIVQEALTNVRKHSQSSKALVRLSQSGDRLRLTIQDWGVGFDPAAVDPDRFGLQGIAKRTALMGGHAEIQSVPGKGTTITVELPIQPSNPA